MASCGQWYPTRVGSRDHIICNIHQRPYRQHKLIYELLPPGYDIRHVDRGRRGGGVALIYKKDISFRNIVTTNEITQFELLDCIVKVNKLSTRVVVVYRPPPSCKNGLRYEDFAVEWASYIEQFVEVQEELLIVGDFNIHVDSSNNESQRF